VEQVQNEHREVADLIKSVHDLRNKGEISKALHQIEKTLSKKEIISEFEDSIQVELVNKKI